MLDADPCMYCGEPLPAERSVRRLYCSRHCKASAALWRRELVDRERQVTVPIWSLVCEVCGRGFRSCKRRARCCSDSCINRRYMRRRKLAGPVDYPPRACAICGEEYKPRQHNSRCCSPECSRVLRNR